MTINTIFSISGNVDVGACCACDKTDSKGTLTHKEQYELFLCQKLGCGHYVCKEHLQSCGYCLGCCAEEHGLESHK